MVSSQRHSFALKTFLRVILFTKKVLGIRKDQSSELQGQHNKNTEECFVWKRITLDDIDRIWRESGKVDAPFREQLSHFAHGVGSILKSNAPDEYRLYWRSITQDDIDRQWAISCTVHPSFGRQFCHFAVGIERIAVKANSN